MWRLYSITLLFNLYAESLLFSCPVMSIWPRGPQEACLTSLSLTISPSLPRFCSLHQWCHLVISSSDALFSLCHWSFPASGTFPMSHLYTSDDQSTGASASPSVLPVNIQGWSPLRLTGLISLLSKGPSGISNTTVRRHQFFGILPSSWSSSHNCMWPLGRP